MADPTVDRAALAAELERARTDFHHLLAIVRVDEGNAPSSGTRWTNEQLLFHMVFGYMIVQRLLILVRLFDRLPDPVCRGFARLLEAATRPFHLINYYGSCLAARFYNRQRMGTKLDRVISALQRSLQRERGFARGMYYPTRWDPYFRDYMTLADIYRYPGRHYEHHRRQLTLAALT
ncbi:DinB family protein [Nocardia vinacea]|uniref:DinB family protein n=1 Tax=Nocardia vinacea TaxID=96468 RepID=UPI00341D03C0